MAVAARRRAGQTDATDVRRERLKLIGAAVIFAAAGGLLWYRLAQTSPAEDAARHRVFICSETGEKFVHTVEMGESEPVYSPHSGKATGYEAERCFWTKAADGTWKAKTTPTYVLLKQRVDPESTDATNCPDCGREVVGHNPMPPPELMDAAAAEAGGG